MSNRYALVTIIGSFASTSEAMRFYQYERWYHNIPPSNVIPLFPYLRRIEILDSAYISSVIRHINLPRGVGGVSLESQVLVEVRAHSKDIMLQELTSKHWLCDNDFGYALTPTKSLEVLASEDESIHSVYQSLVMGS